MSNYAKTPTVFQMEFTECGAASLAMIFAYYGRYVPLEQMRVETGVSRDGSTAKNIKKAAERFGFEVHGYRKETNSLKQISTPCIIHWNLEHFVVFEGFKGKYAYINDPAVGRRKLTCEELDESFTGIVLTFKPTKAFSKGKKQKTTATFVKERIKGQKVTILQLLFVGLLLVFPGLTIPAISQVFMDDVLIGGNTDWFVKTFNEIDLYPRTDIHIRNRVVNFPKDFSISVSNDGLSFTTVKEFKNADAAPYSPMQALIGTQNARYIKITATRTGLRDNTGADKARVQLQEIAVFNS